MAKRAAPKRAATPTRGKRRATKKPVHRRPHFVVPTVLLVLTLAVGSTSAGWISGRSATPTLSPAPTLVVDPSPSINPSQMPSVTPGPVLSFATWNIAKPQNTAVPKWAKRRDAMARTINQSLADVLALQEANAQWVTNPEGEKVTAWDDVQALAKPGGYVAPDEQENKCKAGCVHSAHLLYRTSTVNQVQLKNGQPSAGQGKLSDIASGLHYAKNREFSWAFLEGKNGSGPFLAVSVHLNNERNTTGKRDRMLVGKSLTTWANEKVKKSELGNIPLILMGDFNSYAGREPRGMAYQLKKAGWHDSYDAAKNEFKFFDQAYTVSYTKGNRSGWPKKPITKKNPVRIDYVMYTGTGLHADIYSVDLYLKPDGTFDNNYRSSDHMMVHSIIYFDAASQFLATSSPSPSTSP